MAESLEECVELPCRTGKVVAVNLRCETQRLDGIGGVGAGSVPTAFHAALYFDMRVAVSSIPLGAGNAHIVGKDGELTEAEVVHLGKLTHNLETTSLSSSRLSPGCMAHTTLTLV